MQERAEAIRADFSIQSSPGAGSDITTEGNPMTKNIRIIVVDDSPRGT